MISEFSKEISVNDILRSGKFKVVKKWITKIEFDIQSRNEQNPFTNI